MKAPEHNEFIEKALHDVLDCMPDGITIQNTELTVVYQNRQMREMFGPKIGE